jgi:hypothetical protein
MQDLDEYANKVVNNFDAIVLDEGRIKTILSVIGNIGNYAAERAAKKLSSDTHSIIDGLNRSKNAIMNNQKTIYAVEIDKSKLVPLSTQRAKELDAAAAKARKSGDYFTGSTFGNDKVRYSVQDALDLAKTQKPKKISTQGFVDDQVSKWWQGDLERAKRAIPGKDKPILIMKN